MNKNFNKRKVINGEEIEFEGDEKCINEILSRPEKEKIVDYILLTASYSSLPALIKAHLDRGYQPYGDPIKNNNDWIIQAMVLMG